MLYYKLNTMGDGSNPDLAFSDNMVHGTNFNDHNCRMSLGRSAVDVWAPDCHLKLNKGGQKLCDLVGSTNSQIYVSRRVADVIRSTMTHADAIEFLPLTIRDSRRRVLSTEYVLVNPIGVVDCLDHQASDIYWDDEKPGEVIRLRTAVLSTSKLTEPRTLFRVKENPMLYVITTLLAEPLRGTTTNLYWQRLEVR